MMKKVLLAAGFAFALMPSAKAQSTAAETAIGYLSTVGCAPGQSVCFKPFTSSNPLPVTGAAGGGGSADQTGTNATDGQATSTANQHDVSYGYIFNGTTWDRQRGTNGAANVAVTNFPSIQPVSGTVTASQAGGTTYAVTWTGQTVAATQSGAYTVTQGPAGATAWKVDGSGVTQPVSGSVSVSNFPTTQAISGTVTANLGTLNGAALAANQPTNAAQASATSGETGTLGFAAASSAAPTLTTAQSYPLSLTLLGALRVDGSAVTQPVSMASAPLPTGAATAANQTNVESAAGTPATTLLTVQGAAGGVSIPVTPSNATTAATAANQNVTAAGTSAANAQGVQGVTAGVPLNVTQTRVTNFSDQTSASIVNTNSTAPSHTLPSSAYTKYNAFFQTSQAATVFIQGSNDGFTATGYTVYTASISSAGFALASVPITFTSYRAYITVGATASTVVVTSSFTAN